MTVHQLHTLTTKLITQNRGDAEVGIDLSQFIEDDASIRVIDSAKYRRVQGADDSGPVGPKFPFLVLSLETT